MFYNVLMITILLILINTVMFILVRMGKIDADKMSMSYYSVSVNKEYYRIITSAFTHYDITHFVMNMFSLYNVGSITEDLLGPIRMLIVYFGSMILGKILSLQIRHANHDDYTLSLGASGAICGLMGAYMFVIIKYLGMSAISYFYRPIISLIVMSILPGIDGISHISCLSMGMLIAFVMTLLW